MKSATVESDRRLWAMLLDRDAPTARAAREPKALEQLADRLYDGPAHKGRREADCAGALARRSSDTATDGPKPEDARTMLTANELNEIYQAELDVLAPGAGAIRHMLAETRRRPPGTWGPDRPAWVWSDLPLHHRNTIRYTEAAVRQLRADGRGAARQLAARGGRGGRHALLRRYRPGREPEADPARSGGHRPLAGSSSCSATTTSPGGARWRRPASTRRG